MPISMSFTLIGTPSQVSYDIGGNTFACNPTAGDDRRFHCAHPGLDALDVAEGPAELRLTVTDDAGRGASAAAPIELDFTCPRIVSLAISAPIAAVNEDVVVSVETSERVDVPPSVSRLGRRWEQAAGDGRSFAVTHRVDAQDAGGLGDVLVRVTDRAGNRSSDCGADGRVAVAVDHTPPVANIHDVELVRGAPGEGSSIRAGAGAFLDDVGIDHVRLLDSSGTDLLAALTPELDGSLKRTTLPGLTANRVTLQAIDRFGRASAPVSILERWRLSLGTASTPGASVKTGARLSTPPPSTTALHVRTAELAPALVGADTRSLVVGAPIGMRKVAELSTRYEDTSRIPAAYDSAGKAVVLVGGYQTSLFSGGSRLFVNWLEEVTILRWDELDGQYRVERGPALSRTEPEAPIPMYARGTFAFNRGGCGVINGGEAIDYNRELWQLCGSAGGYRWSKLERVESRGWPLIYDPYLHRYLSVEGQRVQALLPGAGTKGWRWVELPVPSMYGQRNLQAAYWDPAKQAVVMGLWDEHMLTYMNNTWAIATVPLARRLTAYNGHAYDTARQQLVVWGGARWPDSPPEEAVWFQTASSTATETVWRSSTFSTPIGRLDPVVVYDEDRESTLMFGGVRGVDSRVVPPDVFELTAQPSYPYAIVDIDLVAPRPKGIAHLHLDVRATGLGDADGVGPASETAGGVAVSLWDADAGHWETVREQPHAAGAQMATISIDVTDAPARFVSLAGQVSVALRSLDPSTEAVDGRLEVDLIDGYLELAAGVALP